MVQHLIHLYVLSHSRPGALATLERSLALAKAGHGGMLFIRGVPGIGKTSLALVAEAWSQANGAAFARAHAYQRGMPPLQLWQDVLAGLETSVNLDLVSLPEPFGRAVPAQSAPHLARALSLRLQTAAARSPLVLLFDDLHWADQDSPDLLEIVSRSLELVGLLIIVTYRGDVLQRDHPLYQLLQAELALAWDSCGAGKRPWSCWPRPASRPWR